MGHDASIESVVTTFAFRADGTVGGGWAVATERSGKAAERASCPRPTFDALRSVAATGRPRAGMTNGGLSREQIVGLHDSALQCGVWLEDGLGQLEGYRGEPETRNPKRDTGKPVPRP